MKELTIEEKAKRYNDILGKAKKFYDANTNEGYRGIFEEIFPEFIESDDEKIRKELIEKVKETPACIGFNDKNAVLTWLEKQGKRQTPQNNERAWLYLVADVLTWSEGIGQYLDNPKVQELAKKLQKEYGQKLYIEEQGNTMDINPSEFDLRLNKLLKQFETLPKEELASSLSFYLNAIQNDGTYKDEQKADWSEEDIRNINDIDSVLFYDKDLPEDTCVRLRNWLESLRPQPKKVWSEEDERTYKSIIYSFAHNYPLTIQQKEFVKSLRPQKQWKPTEAQLASLTIACDRNDRVGFDLTELLKELKKL